MPTIHDAKSINQRLGKVIKNVEKLKNEIGIFDNLDQHVRRLEQATQHKVDTLENKQAIAKKKEAEKKRIEEEEAAAAAEQAELDDAVEARAAELEAEQEAETAEPADPEKE